MNFYQVFSASCCVWVIKEGAGSAAGIRNGLLSLNTSFHHQRLLANIITDSRETGKAPFTDKLSQSSAQKSWAKRVKNPSTCLCPISPYTEFQGTDHYQRYQTHFRNNKQKNNTPPHTPLTPALLVPYSADLKPFLGYPRLLGTGQLRNVSLELSTHTQHTPVPPLEIKQDPSPHPSLHVSSGSSGLLSKIRFIFSSKEQIWQVFIFR